MNAEQVGHPAQLRELFTDVVLEAGMQVPDIAITDITTDSQRVTSGALFMACRGTRQHGLEFAANAVAGGAAAIAWEPDDALVQPELPDTVVNFAVPNLGDQVGQIADRFFAKPSEHADVIGVTGTNGKTTTAWLVNNALDQLGRTSGYMGTLGFGVGTDLSPSALTTPGVISVHRRLRQMVDAGADTVVMEVSSHGLDQGRIDAVNVVTAAFTNLSRDHLDYHGSLEAYKQAKARLFSHASVQAAVINIGDEFGGELAATASSSIKVITVAVSGAGAPASAPDVLADVLATDSAGMTLRLSGKYGHAEMHSPLWGHFNAENIVVAIGVLLVHGYSLDAAADALQLCGAPDGRMQVLGSGADAPLVVVDFAHTPDALSKAIEVVREHCSGSVTVVFGCGGERDKGKRGEMGSAASRLANRIIVTDDNPRNEDPQVIVKEILAGFADGAAVEVEHDRARAIESAIAAAQPGDAVLVAGKGSENYQLAAGRALPFSDVAVATDVLGGAS